MVLLLIPIRGCSVALHIVGGKGINPLKLTMPTYEYFCTKCEQEFELFQSMNDKALATCPKGLCRLKTWGKGKVKKKIGAGAGIIFKGSGFYITDYWSDNYKESVK